MGAFLTAAIKLSQGLLFYFVNTRLLSMQKIEDEIRNNLFQAISKPTEIKGRTDLPKSTSGRVMKRALEKSF